MIQRWEYRLFNVDDGRVMEVLARLGVDGWEAFALKEYVDICGKDAVRIYCKRALPLTEEADPIEIPDGEGVDWLEVGPRTYHMFDRLGIRSVRQLVLKTEKDLLECRGFGRRSLQELKQVLAERGLHLGMPPGLGEACFRMMREDAAKSRAEWADRHGTLAQPSSL